MGRSDQPLFRVAVRLRSPRHRRLSGVFCTKDWAGSLRALRASADACGGRIEGYTVRDKDTGERIASGLNGAPA